MEDGRYRLELIDGEHTVIHTFPAEIRAEEMRWWLEDFLLGCSWNTEQVREILNKEGE